MRFERQDAAREILIGVIESCGTTGSWVPYCVAFSISRCVDRQPARLLPFTSSIVLLRCLIFPVQKALPKCVDEQPPSRAIPSDASRPYLLSTHALPARAALPAFHAQAGKTVLVLRSSPPDHGTVHAAHAARSTSECAPARAGGRAGRYIVLLGIPRSCLG